MHCGPKSLKPRLHEQFLWSNFYVTSFICSCTWGHLLWFYVANTFAEKLVCQFLCGKQKLSITSISSCMTRHIFVTCIYLHVCQALCDYNVAVKTNFCVESKNISCIIYTSNRICHEKLSNKNCSCKRSLRKRMEVFWKIDVSQEVDLFILLKFLIMRWSCVICFQQFSIDIGNASWKMYMPPSVA